MCETQAEEEDAFKLLEEARDEAKRVAKWTAKLNICYPNLLKRFRRWVPLSLLPDLRYAVKKL